MHHADWNAHAALAEGRKPQAWQQPAPRRCKPSTFARVLRALFGV